MQESGEFQPRTTRKRKKCGEQDSNLRTDKDCDLNAAPLTKLGDPRVVRRVRSLFIKEGGRSVEAHWAASAAAFLRFLFHFLMRGSCHLRMPVQNTTAITT